MTIIIKNKETLIFEDFKFRCVIGQKGFSNEKVEGDKKTPKGIFKLGSIFYRKDRIQKPTSKLRCIPIKDYMGWCDDPKDQKNYNKLIKIEKNIKKYEKLFRKDNNYDLLIPILYNSKKVKLGKGSAIFIHLTKNYKKTLGCIALKKKDLLILLKIIKKNTKIKIS